MPLLVALVVLTLLGTGTFVVWLGDRPRRGLGACALATLHATLLSRVSRHPSLSAE